MTPITDIALPDDVVQAAAKAMVEQSCSVWSYRSATVQDEFRLYAKAAIRAALQAMLDNGMATVSEVAPRRGQTKISRRLIIRLDADERKRAAIRALAPTGEGGG